MKYIVAQDEYFDREEIYLFSRRTNHRDFYDQFIKKGLISAGFVNKSWQCHGHSYSLKCKSRGEEDTRMLQLASEFEL